MEFFISGSAKNCNTNFKFYNEENVYCFKQLDKIIESKQSSVVVVHHPIVVFKGTPKWEKPEKK